MIEVRGLMKSFGDKLAVDHVDLTVGPGVFFTFLGPNGAGKTTSMKILAGLLRPDAGEVRIGGIDLLREPVRAKKIIGYIPDHPFLYNRLTGWEMLEFIGGLYSMSRDEVQSRGSELLGVFDLGGEADRLVGAYSHGMRQRLAFAACFLHAPRVVIIDEPWVGLDPRNIRAAIEFLKAKAKEGVTIFMSTHSLDIAEEVAERIGILHRGRLVYDGPLSALQAAEPRQDFERIFLEITK